MNLGDKYSICNRKEMVELEVLLTCSGRVVQETVDRKFQSCLWEFWKAVDFSVTGIELVTEAL